MKHGGTVAENVRLYMAVVYLSISIGPVLASAEQAEVLQVTVGKPTFLSEHKNLGGVAASRTGVVAAFYFKPGVEHKVFRTSTDGGTTWGEEMPFPSKAGEVTSVGLREGGVLFMEDAANPVKDGKPGELEATREFYSDDFMHHEVGVAKVFIPDAVLNTQYANFWPYFNKGRILQLANGDLIAVMYGTFKGDTTFRTFLVRSADVGKTWHYYTTVAYEPQDPDPGLPGHYAGFPEPGVALLPDGRFLCVMRTQGEAENGEYRPLYMSWSDVQGQSWTKPVPTEPHLMNIWPTLAVLDNGVVACEYSRPGLHVAFSVDDGRTWRDRVSFTDLHVPIYVSLSDMVKVAANRLVVIGWASDGIKVWPVDVERSKVSPARAELTGHVLDQAGHPIPGATVELGPNRYTADCWMEGPELDKYKFQPLPTKPPVLAYRTITKDNPTVQTDVNGRFAIDNVKLGEYVLTVEADNFAPQWRHVNLGANDKDNAHDFQLKPGRQIRGQVVDHTEHPVGGACIVLNGWHTHTDPEGFFCWATDAPLPDDVTVKIYKRYNGDYARLEEKRPLSQIEKLPLVLQPAK